MQTPLPLAGHWIAARRLAREERWEAGSAVAEDALRLAASLGCEDHIAMELSEAGYLLTQLENGKWRVRPPRAG